MHVDLIIGALGTFLGVLITAYNAYHKNKRDTFQDIVEELKSERDDYKKQVKHLQRREGKIERGITKMRLDINLIWAIVVLLVAGMATAYSLNKQKLEKIALTHPKLAKVLETAGELALKATTYQASLNDKEGAKKLYDATDEVYYQIQKLYPNIPIDRATVRNVVQHEYEKMLKKEG